MSNIIFRSYFFDSSAHQFQTIMSPLRSSISIAHCAPSDKSNGPAPEFSQTPHGFVDTKAHDSEQNDLDISTLRCVSKDFTCSLRISQHATVLQLSERLGQLMHTTPSQLVLICNDCTISRHPLFTLKDLGVFTSLRDCKVLISKKPAKSTWPRIIAVFLCSSSLSPLAFRMHSDSSVAQVKRQLRELLRCPVAVLSLHLADGAALLEVATLRELGVADGHRLYCRIWSEEPAASSLDAAAATVREQVRQADALYFDGVRSKRRGQDDEAAGCDRNDGGKSAKGTKTFLGVRRGFLCAPEAAPTKRSIVKGSS